jgi:hypothetical protein
MDCVELGCEDGRWMELAQDHALWQDLVLAVVMLWVLVPHSKLSDCKNITGKLRCNKFPGTQLQHSIYFNTVSGLLQFTIWSARDTTPWYYVPVSHLHYYSYSTQLFYYTFNILIMHILILPP